MLIDLLSKHSRINEKIIILYMAYENQYVELPEECFYNSNTRKCYVAIKSQYLKNASIEINTLPDYVKEMILEIGDMNYPRNISLITEDLLNNLRLRNIAKIIIQSTNDITPENVSDRIGEITQQMSGLITSNKIEYEHGKSVASILEFCRDQKESDRQLIGISSGLENFDKHIGGFQKKKTYILGGMEKLGKSRFCTFLTSVWSKKKIGGMWFSMEMSENDIHECIIAHRSNINSALIGSPGIDSQDFRKMLKDSQPYINEPVSISTESSITPEYIREKIRAQKIIWHKKGFEVVYVVVDYIQRMVYGDNQAKQLEDTAKRLSNIARDENIIMIVISQLSQAAESNVHKLSPHQFIKGSKGIREAADGIFVLYKDNDCCSKAESKELKIYIVQRKGQSNVFQKLEAQLQFSNFKEISNESTDIRGDEATNWYNK